MQDDWSRTITTSRRITVPQKMIIRATLLLLVAIAFSSCKEEPLVKFGDTYTTGPNRGPDGEILSNTITFHYEAKNPETVHLLVGGNRVKTVMITGKVNWRIEVIDQKVKVSNEHLILEAPVTEGEILDSNVVVNESKQMAFDISVGNTKVLMIDCPEKLVGVQP